MYQQVNTWVFQIRCALCMCETVSVAVRVWHSNVLCVYVRQPMWCSMIWDCDCDWVRTVSAPRLSPQAGRMSSLDERESLRLDLTRRENRQRMCRRKTSTQRRNSMMEGGPLGWVSVEGVWGGRYTTSRVEFKKIMCEDLKLPSGQ